MIALLTMILLIYNPGDKIIIKDQWLRPGAEKMATALYFTIENNGTEADTLYAVESSVSNKIQIHETYSLGEIMGMREIGTIVVNPKEEVKLEPGGKHIMVMKLNRDIKKGDEVEFVLHFKNAGDISITAETIQ